MVGHPFGEDYPDGRSDGDRERDRREVQTQVETLSSSPAPDDLEERLLHRLIDRRKGPGDQAVLQVDVLRSRGGARTLVVPGQLLLSRAALDDPVLGVRERLQDAGLDEAGHDGVADCPELADRVVRFAGAVPSERLAGLASRLRAEGVAVSVENVVPLAAVVKGEGGPALTRGRREFPGTPFSALSSGPRVAVVDTGIAEEKRDDGWLAHGLVERRADNIDVIDAFPPPGNGFLDMASGHGTFVTGVIQQVCPTADIVVYRGPDSDGVASEVQIACALVRAVREGADIVNLSLGTQTVDDGPPVALAAALDVIADIEAAQGREVLIVAAAGNYGDTRPCWPAAFRRVVSVAGLTAAGSVSSWSSRGAWVDCATVGEGVVSTLLPGPEDPTIDTHHPDTFGHDSWAVWTGTSFAAPQVTGAIARLCQQHDISPREALTQLLATGVLVPDHGQAVVVLPGT